MCILGSALVLIFKTLICLYHTSFERELCCMLVSSALQAQMSLLTRKFNILDVCVIGAIIVLCHNDGQLGRTALVFFAPQ